jgi:hypothetical protein
MRQLDYDERLPEQAKAEPGLHDLLCRSRLVR